MNPFEEELQESFSSLIGEPLNIKILNPLKILCSELYKIKSFYPERYVVYSLIPYFTYGARKINIKGLSLISTSDISLKILAQKLLDAHEITLDEGVKLESLIQKHEYNQMLLQKQDEREKLI